MKKSNPAHEKLGWGLYSDRATFLRRLVHIFDKGGGDFSSKTLGEEHGLYLQDWQIRNYVDELVLLSYLTIQKDEQGNAIGYNLSEAGREMGLYIEYSVQDQRSRDW